MWSGLRLYFWPTSVPYLQKRITKMLGSEYRKGYKFANDTNSSFSVTHFLVLYTEMSKDLHRIFTWLCYNKLTITNQKYLVLYLW